MKKLLTLLLMVPFLFSCSSDDSEETVDLTKYPLYGTKWVSEGFDEDSLKDEDEYHLFDKETAVYGLFYKVATNNHLWEAKRDFTYTYEPPIVKIAVVNQSSGGYIKGEGYISNDTLYLNKIRFLNNSVDTVQVVYTKSHIN